MDTNIETARRVLKALLDRDLVAVRSNDGANELLARTILDADPDDLVNEILRALDRDDVIDEIYTTDKELAEVIRGALSPITRASESVVGPAEYWLQMSDGFAHETWSGPFPSPAVAEAQGWRSREGIYVSVIRRQLGMLDEVVGLIGDPEDGLDKE